MTIPPSLRPMVITPGDPAGIGPDITLAALAELTQANQLPPCVIIASRTVFAARSAQLGYPPLSIPAYDPSHPQPCALIDIPTINCQPQQPDVGHGPHLLKTLKRALAGCLNNEFSAWVTGPVNKAIIHQFCPEFTGHTAWLQAQTHSPDVVMTFMAESYRLALLTCHIPLHAVPAAITPDHLESTCLLLHTELQNKLSIQQPRILIAGLNPHAGEDGVIGDEEQRIITPTIQKLQAQGYQIIGPYAADTLLHQYDALEADIALSLYHDQLLPALKALVFGHMSQTSLGLPFIRTSVDHGTAYGLAGTGKATHDSLIHAIKLASQMHITQQQAEQHHDRKKLAT